MSGACRDRPSRRRSCGLASASWSAPSLRGRSATGSAASHCYWAALRSSASPRCSAPSLIVLTVLRFFTGLGIGGAFPGAATLAGDYAPHRLRATMIMATFTGAPVGGFVGGQIVAVLLPHFGWPVIFVLGGVFPLVLVPVLVLWLPEALRFLARKQNLSVRHAAVLQRLDIAPGQAE